MGTRTWEVTIKERTIKIKLAKSKAESLAHRIKEATVNLPQYTRELYTDSFDGQDHSSITMVLFGKGKAPILDPEAWMGESSAALDKWAAILVTEANLSECAADFKAIYDKHLPVLDKRRSPEQIAAEKREQAEREATRISKEKAELEAFLSKFSNGPETEKVSIPDGYMAIYLSVTYDNSDAMTDYFDRHRSTGTDLLLAVVRKQAETQALARMAISRYPELSAITSWSWHTEKYSMGHGNYLESGYETTAHGWDRDANEHREINCKFEVQFDKYAKSKYPYKGYPGNAYQSAQAEVAAPVSLALGDGITATISRNTAKDGIEIRFSDRPDDEVISRLKAARWRWSRFSKCWYTRYSPQAEAFAGELVKSLQPESETQEPAEDTTIPPAEVSADLAAEVFKDSPEEEAEETLTADDMSAITGQEWTEEAMEQFRACC